VNGVHNGEEVVVATAKSNPTAKEIWDKLSAVNVNEHTDDKAGLTYLSWAWAWSYMMDHYPDLTVKWHGTTDENGVTRDITTYPGGTAMVSCSVTIGDVKREMWLPVKDYRGKAITNPDSMAINTAKMRCLTKCFGIFGLGCYIYAGEDVPKETVAEDPPKKKEKKSKAAKKPKKATKKAVEEDDTDELIRELKRTVRELHERGWTPANGADKKQITDAIDNRDREAIIKLTKQILVTGNTALQLHDAGEEQTDG
jgi:hypothetical protein